MAKQYHELKRQVVGGGITLEERMGLSPRPPKKRVSRGKRGADAPVVRMPPPLPVAAKSQREKELDASYEQALDEFARKLEEQDRLGLEQKKDVDERKFSYERALDEFGEEWERKRRLNPIPQAYDDEDELRKEIREYNARMRGKHEK